MKIIKSRNIHNHRPFQLSLSTKYVSIDFSISVKKTVFKKTLTLFRVQFYEVPGKKMCSKLIVFLSYFKDSILDILVSVWRHVSG